MFLARFCMLLLMIMTLIDQIRKSEAQVSNLRASPVEGKLNFRDKCETQDIIDHMYQIKGLSDAELLAEIANHICNETRNLRCVNLEEQSSSKYLENDYGVCHCYDGYIDSRPTVQSTHLTYDEKLGKCLTNVHQPCGLTNEIADPRNSWRYDRKDFETDIPCVSNAKCLEKKKKMSINGVFKYYKICECVEGYIPKPGGGCFNPKVDQFFNRFIAVFSLFLIWIILSAILPFEDEYHSSTVGDHVLISISGSVGKKILHIYGDLDKPFHPTNIDGSEKNFYQILQWLSAKSGTLAIKHNIFWKYGVFVRCDDDTRDNSKENMTSNFISKKIKQEIKHLIPHDGNNCGKYFIVRSERLRAGLTHFGVFTHRTGEKKSALTLRSPITLDNELTIRHIDDLKSKDFLKYMKSMYTPPNYPYCVIRNDPIIPLKKVILFDTKKSKDETNKATGPSSILH